jgi:Na+/melibiose symporter-like transporter
VDATRPGRLLAYGLTGLPLAALGLPLYVYLPAFYAADVGVAATAVGLALLAARLFDVLTDPLAGWLSDRWPRGPWRRKGLMLIGAPLLLLGIEQLFRPAAGADAATLLGWSLVAYLGWTLIAIPYAAWGAELSAESHGRTRVAAAREGFVIAGTLAALVVPALYGVAADPAGTLEVMAQWLWLALPAALLVTVAAVPAVPARDVPRPRWGAGLRLLVANRPMRRLFAAYLLNGTANGLPATLFLLFVGHVLAAPDRTGLLLAVYFTAGVVALPAWVWLARRRGKQAAWNASLLLAAVTFAWVPLLGPGDVTLFLVVCALSGLSLGADLALPASIQADLVEADRQAGGGDRAGLLFGLWGTTTKLALALAVGIAFPLLDLAGFAADRPDNDAASLTVLALLYGGLPVLLKLAALALMRPLGRRATPLPSDGDDHESAKAAERIGAGRPDGDPGRVRLREA